MINISYPTIAGLAFAVFVTWYATSDHYQKRIAETQLQTAQAVQAQLLEYEKKLKTAEDQHAKDQLNNNALRAKLSRVQIHIPSCPALPPTGENTDGGARAFSEKLDGLFAELQRRLADDAARCDQLNIDAIKTNNSQ